MVRLSSEKATCLYARTPTHLRSVLGVLSEPRYELRHNESVNSAQGSGFELTLKDPYSCKVAPAYVHVPKCGAPESCEHRRTRKRSTHRLLRPPKQELLTLNRAHTPLFGRFEVRQRTDARSRSAQSMR